MTATVAAHATERVQELGLKLRLLQIEHVEWLANYLEWSNITRRGTEDLSPEISLAACQLTAIRKEMKRVQTMLDFWNTLKKSIPQGEHHG